MGHLIALLYRRRNIGQRNYRPCMDLFMSWHCALDARSSLDSARESACGRIAMHDASRCLALMQECEPQLLSRSAASSAAVVCDPKQHFIAFHTCAGIEDVHHTSREKTGHHLCPHRMRLVIIVCAQVQPPLILLRCAAPSCKRGPGAPPPTPAVRHASGRSHGDWR